MAKRKQMPSPRFATFLRKMQDEKILKIEISEKKFRQFAESLVVKFLVMFIVPFPWLFADR